MTELFPAYAGVIPGTSGRAGHGKTFPRPCGGDLYGVNIYDAQGNFSPPCGGDPLSSKYIVPLVNFSPPTRG